MTLCNHGAGASGIRVHVDSVAIHMMARICPMDLPSSASSNVIWVSPRPDRVGKRGGIQEMDSITSPTRAARPDRSRVLLRSTHEQVWVGATPADAEISQNYADRWGSDYALQGTTSGRMESPDGPFSVPPRRAADRYGRAFPGRERDGRMTSTMTLIVVAARINAPTYADSARR